MTKSIGQLHPITVYRTVLCVRSSGVDCHYRKTFSISRTLVGNKIVENSDVVGASPVGAAPTTSSFFFFKCFYFTIYMIMSQYNTHTAR